MSSSFTYNGRYPEVMVINTQKQKQKTKQKQNKKERKKKDALFVDNILLGTIDFCFHTTFCLI